MKTITAMDMETTLEKPERKAAVCPMHAMHAMHSMPSHADEPIDAGFESTRLEPNSELFFPMHKRVIAQYSTDPSGAAELHLYYGDKEISFDEPELFGFGETLALQSRFTARSATAWGEGYEWPRVRELLEQLLEGGILRHADEADPESTHDFTKLRDGARPSPLPRAQTATPRNWLDCEAVTADLTGRPLELGYLELVVPIFRVAHMALDADGRQVGEANVFPKPLRLDVPTRWRACIYSGSRFQDERPMNVSALKTMRAYWPQMMEALRRIRAAYLRRFPAARSGWTVADLERLSTLVLAVPTYQLMRRDHRVENGELHPALSSLFRVADGLRMTTHQMLFVPVAEATLSPDAPITSADVYAYAERNYSFHSTHGVCAGPKAMIEEFLGVLVDGREPRDFGPEAGAHAELDAAVEAALASIEAAFDYGLYGLQAHAAVFSLWPVMTRTYERLWEVVRASTGAQSETLSKFGEHLRAKVETLKNESLHATEAWRTNREQVYAHIYEHCRAGAKPERSLHERISAANLAREAMLERTLSSILRRELASGATAGADVEFLIEALVECLASYFLQAKAILGVACEVQQRINALLGRTPPVRPFYAEDIDIHVLLQGDEARRLPYLLEELEALLGFRAEITRDAVTIIETSAGRSTDRPDDRICRHGAGR